MSDMELEAHRIAHLIEWGRARELGRACRRKPEAMFDEHAATELGNLIFGFAKRYQTSLAQGSVDG